MTKTKAKASTQASAVELKNRQVAYEAALESIVLLKNDGALPLKETRVALFGAGGRKTITGGSGSGEVNGRYRVSVEEGLEEKGLTITTKAWLDSYDVQWERDECRDLCALPPIRRGT